APGPAVSGLSAAHRLPLRHHRRLRGTGALAASALRPRAAGPLHPAGRVQRPHRRADRAHRVPGAGLVRGPARRARAADRRRGLPTDALVSRHWLDRLRLSINISPLTLSNESLFERLLERLRALDLPPSRIVLELTESSAMANQAASLGFLTRLRIKGFQLAIDDFGTGYSSMLQLVRLPFSEIKVDKSFVMTCRNSQESRSVTRSVVGLGRSLGLESTAEGVEDEETLQFLREIGCDLVQGFHVSPPLDGDGALSWVTERCRMDEQSRLRSLYGLHVLDTAPEERFDRI